MKRTLFLFLASLALTMPMLAQIPVYLNHQGYIADSTGIGVTGTLPMTFRFFDDSTGGLAILTDSRGGVDLSKGIFSVNIDVSSLSFSSQYWLETEVDGQTLSPRARLTASPYARRAVVADSALTLKDGSVTSAKVQNGSLQRADVTTTFKSPYADTADYAKAAFPGADGFTDDGAVVRLTSPGDNVGIGTASPSKKLEVSGDAVITDTLFANKVRISDGTQGSGKILTSDGSGVASWQSPGQAGFPSGSEGQVMRYSGSEWGASPDMSIDTNGRVGIGTTSPTQKLEVNGDAKVGGTLTASALSSNSPLLLQTDGTTRVFVDDSAGLVGVGTLTPSHRLDVSGSAAVSDTFYGNKVKIADGTQGSGKILTSDGSGVASWQAPGQAGFPSGADGQMMRYDGSQWEASDAVYSDSSGKIGIGTTAPQRMLTVVDTTSEANRQVTELAHGTGDANFRLVTMNGEASNAPGTPMVKMGMVYGAPGGGSAALISFHRGASGGDGAISFSTNNDVERMRITSLGNVGIGTNTTYNKLDVEGAVAIGSGFSGSYVAPTDGLIVAGAVGIGTNIPSNKLSVSGNANVTGNLTVSKLIANGLPAASTGLDLSSADQYAEMRVIRNTLGSADKDVYLQYLAGLGTKIHLFSNNTETMTLTNGRVGVGTISPANKLDVEGAAVIGAGYSGATTAPPDGLLVQGPVGLGTSPGGLTRFHVVGPANGGAFRFVDYSLGSGTTAGTHLLAEFQSPSGYGPQLRFLGVGGGFMDIGENAQGAFVVEGNDNPRLVVTNAGSVGIGTTAPAFSLDVAGSLRSTGGYSFLNQSFDNSQGNVGIGVGPSTVVKLFVSSNQSYTLYSSNVAGGYAGYFSGNVGVTGLLSKGGGSFKIDHPVDPDNKWLYHSFVESPDMMNVYNGNIVTDASGKATVDLPDYFEALNRDFRYQLTVVGQFAQAIVDSKVQGNRFVIRTDKPNVEVSWQVTGIRNDAFANAHRIVPEVTKSPEEKGRYLYPKELGMPESTRIKPVEDQPVKEDRQ